MNEDLLFMQLKKQVLELKVGSVKENKKRIDTLRKQKILLETMVEEGKEDIRFIKRNKKICKYLLVVDSSINLLELQHSYSNGSINLEEYNQKFMKSVKEIRKYIEEVVNYLNRIQTPQLKTEGGTN